MGPWRNLVVGLLVMSAVSLVIVFWPRELTPPLPVPVAGSETPVLPEASVDPEVPSLPSSRRERPAPSKLVPRQPGHGVPSDLLESLRDCLALAPGRSRTDGTAKAEASIQLLTMDDFQLGLERDLGPAMAQGDLWTEWVVRLSGGLDRKIHLENRENSEGHIQRRLSVYQLDQTGQTQPLKIDGLDEENPSMQLISSLLNEGEVLRKESSKYYRYAGGERLEFIEVDSLPVELEIVRGQVFFRCDHLKSPDACTCIR